jgi:hypothetical protein
VSPKRAKSVSTKVIELKSQACDYQEMRTICRLFAKANNCQFLLMFTHEWFEL